MSFGKFLLGASRHYARHLTLEPPHCEETQGSVWKSHTKKERERNPLAAQWLGLHASPAKGPGSTPGQGSRVLQSVQCSQRKKERKEEERKREKGRERRRGEGRERKYILVWPYSTHPNPHCRQVKEEGPLDIPSQQRCYRDKLRK